MENLFLKTLTIAISLKAYLQLCHWGVRGPLFYQYHSLFLKLYELIDSDVDSIAEQANICGVFLNSQIFKEPISLNSSSPEPMINASLLQLDAYKSELLKLNDAAEAANKLGTVNMIQGVLTNVDKAQYLLEASLPNRKKA